MNKESVRRNQGYQTGGGQRAYPLRIAQDGALGVISTGALHTSRPRLPNATTILVSLGNALMAKGLSEFLACHGYRCCAGDSTTEPDVIVVDSATIGKALSFEYRRARILFLQMEQDAAQVNALLSWHRAHAIIPPSAGLEVFEKILKAVGGGRSRAWSHTLPGTQVPVPFTPQEKKVISCICRGDSTREIAEQLHISPHTVKAHLHAVLAKTGAPNRARLISLIGAWLGGENHERSS